MRPFHLVILALALLAGSAVYGSPLELARLPALDEFDIEERSGGTDRQGAAKAADALLALSLASSFRNSDDEVLPEGRARILRKWGIDRGEALRRGATMLLAYTTEPNPFDLPGGDDDGVTITILRRIVER